MSILEDSMRRSRTIKRLHKGIFPIRKIKRLNPKSPGIRPHPIYQGGSESLFLAQ